jgi:hypothetical protein
LSRRVQGLIRQRQSQPLVARETKPEQTSQRQTEKIRQKDTQAELNDIRAKLRAKQK